MFNQGGEYKMPIRNIPRIPTEPTNAYEEGEEEKEPIIYEPETPPQKPNFNINLNDEKTQEKVRLKKVKL